MALFQQDLQTQVISEQAVEEPSAIGAISGLASAFLKAQPSASTKGAPNYEQSLIANSPTELNILEQLKESGSINQIDFDRRLGDARREISKIDDSKIPQGIQNQYEGLSGRDINSFGFDTNEDYEKAELLKGEFAKAIKPSVVSELEAAGEVVTTESVNNAVLNKLKDKASLENELNIQNKKLALGQSIDDTAVSKNIKADYDVLASFFKDAAADGIVTKNEFLSAQLGVSNLMTTKYGQFKSNPKINSVMEQMTGLLDDIGKGVSDTPSAVLADTIQIALQNEGFSAGTIAVVRAMQEGKNIGQFQDIMANNKEGKTVADAMVFIAGADLTEDKLVEIFNTTTPPPVADVAGTNPSLLSIPTVKDNPNEYQTVVDKFSESAKTPASNDLLGNKKVRNSFLTSLNVAGSAVASQGDEYILGEKLLSKFASNSIVKNLEAVYSVDPQNAAQTNDVLQAALSSERVRQSLELNNRLDAGVGAGQLVMADAEGKLQLNNEMIEKNKDKLVGGAAGWAEMQGKINAAGGLEKFLQLPPMVNGAINPDASIRPRGTNDTFDTRYLLKDIFSIDFNKVLKLSNNLKLIDSKLVNLESLATKYQDDTDMLRGRSNNNLAPEDRAKVIETIEQDQEVNVPVVAEEPSVDTVGLAPETDAEFVPQAQPGQKVQGGFGRPIPTQFSGGAATIEQEAAVDTVETTPVDRTLTSEQQNSISNVSEITKASNEPITTRAGTYSFTKTNKAIEKSVKNPIKQALLKGAITIETGGAGPVTEKKYTYKNAVAVGGEVWKNRMDAVGLGPNATGEEVFNAVYANSDTGNGDYASGDGNRYRGRGLIQITGKNTYQGVQDVLKRQGIIIDLINNPELANDNKYALPVALAFLEYKGLDETSIDTITTNKLNDFINGGANRKIAEARWEEVIDLLELAGMREKAEELELRNEYAAQEKVGVTADGDIGKISRKAMRKYLQKKIGIVPEGISDNDLVILVNRS